MTDGGVRARLTPEQQDLKYRKIDAETYEMLIDADEERRIVELLGTKKADLTDDDVAHMKKVVGYVRRHTAQGGPKEDKEHSRWRYSLKNWGHDPLK